MKGIEKLTKMNEDFIQAQKELAEKSREVFKEVSQELFETYKKLESFSWTQYTPYFNDGDECIFRVSEYSIKLNEIHTEDEVREDVRGAESDVKKLIKAVNKNSMKDIFGDHSEITIHRDGKITVSDYEHD